MNEARHLIAFDDTDLGNIRYVADSTLLSEKPATKENFAFDTACAQLTFFNQSVFSYNQDLSSPQEIKR